MHLCCCPFFQSARRGLSFKNFELLALMCTSKKYIILTKFFPVFSVVIALTLKGHWTHIFGTNMQWDGKSHSRSFVLSAISSLGKLRSLEITSQPIYPKGFLGELHFFLVLLVEKWNFIIMWVPEAQKSQVQKLALLWKLRTFKFLFTCILFVFIFQFATSFKNHWILFLLHHQKTRGYLWISSLNELESGTTFLYWVFSLRPTFVSGSSIVWYA